MKQPELVNVLMKDGYIKEDRRKISIRPEPKNKLSKEEYQSVLNIVNKSEFADFPVSIMCFAVLSLISSEYLLLLLGIFYISLYS